jgi:RHS repeat-associated protein
VVNQVKREFNGLGQLTSEWQEHAGAVTGSSPRVQYAYSAMAGGANHSRLTAVTYPSGYVLTSTYSTDFGGVDDRISRLSWVSDPGGVLESYWYLGAGTVAIRNRPVLWAQLTYVKQSGEADGDAGDQYTGLDRFGRVVDQRWLRTSDGTHTDRFGYGYDRDGNRLYRDNLVNDDFDELYHANGAANGYDPLNQLSEFRRGPLSDTNSDGIPDTVSTASRSQVWTPDAAGNFDAVSTNGTAQTRTHNRQNEVTAVSGATSPTFDPNGNTTRDEAGTTYAYDAWGRVVGVNGSTRYAYDALSRRVKEGDRALYYTADWQVVEERESGLAVVRLVWGKGYVDALVLRDRDADGNAGNGLEERLWVQQDANWNVTALVTVTGAVAERFAYDPYGVRAVLAANWSGQTGSNYAWVYGHQGGRLDTLTGAYHFRHRDLLASLMRWNRPDPIGFPAGDVNLYRFIAGNPLRLTDPSGLMAPALAGCLLTGGMSAGSTWGSNLFNHNMSWCQWGFYGGCDGAAGCIQGAITSLFTRFDAAEYSPIGCIARAIGGGAAC